MQVKPNKILSYLPADLNIAMDESQVQILIRSCPISSKEMVSQRPTRCLREEGDHSLRWSGSREILFTFDHIMKENASQEELFLVAGVPIVDACMAGYNSCMFAYGQTGTGKTYTMLGDIEHFGDKVSENRGMIPRVFEKLFSRIQLEEEQRKDENLKYMVRCSFLEIYGEEIADLLEPASTNLQVHEHERKGVYVQDLSEVVVNSVQDVILLLRRGSANRKVAITNMNRRSGRSHGVVTCTIESSWDCDSLTQSRFARLNLVDLVGNGRQKKSAAEGKLLNEASSINRSLSNLGLVIDRVVDFANGKKVHVPYRDSKLTFLLQDSLGVKSRIILIATVSPAQCNSDETLSTLKFAERFRPLCSKVAINKAAFGSVRVGQAPIEQTKVELDHLRRQVISKIALSQDGVNPVRGSFDSSGDAHKFFGSPETVNREGREMEAVLAGALRREEAAFQNISMREQIRSLQKSLEGGERSGMVEEISSLREQLQEALNVASVVASENALLRSKVEDLLDQLQEALDGAFDVVSENELLRSEVEDLLDQPLEALDGAIAVASENELLRLKVYELEQLVQELTEEPAVKGDITRACSMRVFESEYSGLGRVLFNFEDPPSVEKVRHCTGSFSTQAYAVDYCQQLELKLQLEQEKPKM